MIERPAISWTEANQRYLTAAVAVVRQALVQHVARLRQQTDQPALDDTGTGAAQALAEAAEAMPSPPALEIISKLFGLSAFERDVLVLCAGVELEGSFASACAEAQGAPGRNYATFSLALAALPGAHWSALTPTAPLRRWRLIEIGSGPVLTASTLRIDERILHYLAGVHHFDERLAGLIDELTERVELVPSHRELVRYIAGFWTHQAGSLPVVQLVGSDAADNRSIAAGVASALGSRICTLSAQAVPTGPAELDGLIRLWRREAALSNTVLLLEYDDGETADAARAVAIQRVIRNLNAPLIVTGFGQIRDTRTPVLTVEVPRPTAYEQKQAWQRILNGTPFEQNAPLEALVSQFNLNASKMQTARAMVSARDDENNNKEPASSRHERLWDACRAQARPKVEYLAQRIEPAADWNDLVIPELQQDTLRAIAVHVRRRMTVYETWGFASKSGRGLGISALFAGATGTGKTMAAEVLARELRLDLYRIDLSAVVSKYIGETEKNLRRVFDAAEEGGAILLFDEADALFGKRSEVKDSHDRYANIEISYLLQRMEAYRGLAILTTNLKSALDPAFIRRIRFIVQFPFPDAVQRAAIWQRVFPAETPTYNLDVSKLARLNVAGGNIRNIAMNAAFLAAEAGEPVRMDHLLRAAQAEYSKLEKPLTEAETNGWLQERST